MRNLTHNLYVLLIAALVLVGGEQLHPLTGAAHVAYHAIAWPLIAWTYVLLFRKIRNDTAARRARHSRFGKDAGVHLDWENYAALTVLVVAVGAAGYVLGGIMVAASTAVLTAGGIGEALAKNRARLERDDLRAQLEAVASG